MQPQNGDTEMTYAEQAATITRRIATAVADETDYSVIEARRLAREIARHEDGPVAEDGSMSRGTATAKHLFGELKDHQWRTSSAHQVTI